MPILIVTGDTSPGQVVAARRAAADDYVAKPFRSSDLVARVADALAMPEDHRQSHIRAARAADAATRAAYASLAGTQLASGCARPWHPATAIGR